MDSISLSNLPDLSFFNTLECHYYNGQVCDYRTRPRPFNIFAIIYNGNVSLRGSTGSLDLRAGDAFFLPFAETYTSTWSGTGDLYMDCVYFAFSFHKNPIKEKKYALQKVELEDLAYTKMKFHMVADAIQALSAFDMMEQFYSICRLFFSKMSYVEEPDKTTPIQKALSYLHANYTEPISVKRLADMCYLSESRFMHLFKQITGFSSIEYKNKLAVTRAAQLLRFGEYKNIEEVSEACGFSSPIYFRRVFHAYTGMTPREYRKHG